MGQLEARGESVAMLDDLELRILFAISEVESLRASRTARDQLDPIWTGLLLWREAD